MRRQNPPSAYIRKAEELEKYLRPGAVNLTYVLLGLSWVAIVALVFAGLVLMSFVKPTYGAIAIATLIADVPVIVGAVAYLRYSYDPVSQILRGLANEWRRPLVVPGDQCIFKTGLRKGDEMLIVKLAFHYPVKHKSLEVKERLYTFAHAALTSEFSMMYSLPSYSDIERALEPSMDMLAAEYKIPVLYPEVMDVRKMRVLYDIEELKVKSQEVSPLDKEYLSTGTAG